MLKVNSTLADRRHSIMAQRNQNGRRKKLQKMKNFRPMRQTADINNCMHTCRRNSVCSRFYAAFDACSTSPYHCYNDSPIICTKYADNQNETAAKIIWPLHAISAEGKLTLRGRQQASSHELHQDRHSVLNPLGFSQILYDI